jgi:hypothetical protein
MHTAPIIPNCFIHPNSIHPSFLPQAMASCLVAPRMTIVQASASPSTAASVAQQTSPCGRQLSPGSPPGPAPGALAGLVGTLSAAA